MRKNPFEESEEKIRIHWREWRCLEINL